MSYDNDNHGCEAIGCVVTLFFYVIAPGIVYMVDHDVFRNYIFVYSVAGAAFIISIITWSLYLREKTKREKTESECSQAINKANYECDRKVENTERECSQAIHKTNYECKRKIEKIDKELQKTFNRTNELLKTSAPFVFSASLASDMECYIYDRKISYLQTKPHPGHSSSEVVKEMKEKTKVNLQQYKEMLYKYEFLLKTFPELKRYTNDDEALMSLADYTSIDDFDSNRDHSADYLSTEEWGKLSTDQRNQLALDRYKQRAKSAWIIGNEYEMFVEYTLRQQGFTTIPFGSLHGLSDLGRDIIATKLNAKTGLYDHYIIQCKNWSIKGEKQIHENVVCQTYGTTIEYMISKGVPSHRVISVIVSTVPLSDMAKKFAEKLGVQHWLWAKGDFPMIKCNIGKDGMKIYHLPFDQQYYRTGIKNEGEFYAWTVEEAVKAGFRRAFKHNRSE